MSEVRVGYHIEVAPNGYRWRVNATWDEPPGKHFEEGERQDG